MVEKSKIIDGSAVAEGDIIVGLPSSGPHSNGYSLIRRVLETRGEAPNEDLLDDLLAPTRIYVQSVRALVNALPVHAMVHITGGGFYENVPRVLHNAEHAALIDTSSWRWPDVFVWLSEAGNIDAREMYTTFNCGIGFLLVLAPHDVPAALEILRAQGEAPVQIGRIVNRSTQPNADQLLV